MIALTFDTDYMWEEDLRRFTEEFRLPGRGTFFLWQPFRDLILGNHQLEPHPFLFETRPWREVIEEFEEKWGRRGTVLRPHSCAYSHTLGVYLARSGYRAVSQATYQGEVSLRAYRQPWGLWELPIYYMDSLDFTMPFNWPQLGHKPFANDIIARSLESEGLFVFDFHPLHIILNTSSYPQYRSVRESIVSRSRSCFDLAFPGAGTRQFFELLVERMHGARISSLTCSEVLDRATTPR
jgi:hypothetical protein